MTQRHRRIATLSQQQRSRGMTLETAGMDSLSTQDMKLLGQVTQVGKLTIMDKAAAITTTTTSTIHPEKVQLKEVQLKVKDAILTIHLGIFPLPVLPPIIAISTINRQATIKIETFTIHREKTQRQEPQTVMIAMFSINRFRIISTTIIVTLTIHRVTHHRTTMGSSLILSTTRIQTATIIITI